VVEKEDVNEAMRLMEMSKDSLNPSHEQGRSVIKVVFVTLIFHLMLRILIARLQWFTCSCPSPSHLSILNVYNIV